jgi:hypothetical protein
MILSIQASTGALDQMQQQQQEEEEQPGVSLLHGQRNQSVLGASSQFVNRVAEVLHLRPRRNSESDTSAHK